MHDSSAEISERAIIVPIQLNLELQALKKELAETYKREQQLLNLLGTINSQIKGTGFAIDLALANNGSGWGEPAQDKQVRRDYDQLKARYAALAKSKFGRAQLWYWRLKARK